MDDRDFYFDKSSKETQYALDCKGGAKTLCDSVRKGEDPKRKATVVVWEDVNGCCKKGSAYTTCVTDKATKECAGISLRKVQSYEVSVDGTTYPIFETNEGGSGRRRLLARSSVGARGAGGC